MGTLGRLLVDGVKKFRMFGDGFVVKANIETLGGFSAHAGQRGLIDWMTRFQNAEHRILVHGEEGAMQTLSDKLATEHGLHCQMPRQGEQFTF
jgi:metallo-beta-lactamase family protein